MQMSAVPVPVPVPVPVRVELSNVGGQRVESRAGVFLRRHKCVRRMVVYAAFLLFDSLVTGVAYSVALWLRFDGRVPQPYAERWPVLVAEVVPVYVGANLLLHMYWRGWRYAGLQDALALLRAVSLSTAFFFLIDTVLSPSDHTIPAGVVPIGGLLTLGGMALARFRHRLVQEISGTRGGATQSRTLVIGAGRAGQRLVRELLFTPALGYRPICLVDDEPEKQGQLIHGIRVAGKCQDIPELVQHLRIDVIVYAIPSLTADGQRRILEICELTSARVKIVPGLPELLTGLLGNTLMRDARLEDLLGRAPVVFASSARLSLGGSVLITGAAGSIGSELARHVAASDVEQLILLDANESGLFDIAAELEAANAHADLDIQTAVADVTRAHRVQEIFNRYQPDTVFHAAAYKHVPLMQAHPAEAVITNVVGTRNVCLAAEQAGCHRLVFISTDKAVAPANVMGATKRVGERLIRTLRADGSLIACAVRFGNVLGSRGSVVPTFARQIRQGGPVTVTNMEATRFFMTIPEAASLIIEAAGHAQGGEIFILDMGERVRIADLARKMIRLHGLRPGEDIEIRQVGLRPGEKLHETLTTPAEHLAPTSHPRVSRVEHDGSSGTGRTELLGAVEALHQLAETGPTDALLAALFCIAAGETPGVLATADAVELRA
jgi:FlaA1/EpsC-like NDP-sugar epimerase